MRTILVNDERTVRFVADSVGSGDRQAHSSIGLEQDGKVIAGGVFDSYTAANIFLHFSTSGTIPRDLMRLIFGYAFHGLKVQRVTGAVSAANTKVIKLAKLIGFELEARLSGVYSDGSDMLLFKLIEKNCRFLIPCLTENNVIHGSGIEVKRSGDFTLPHSGIPESSNLSNNFPTQNRAAITLTKVAPAFFAHISHVLPLSANEKMRGIDAVGIVAPMENVFTRRAKMQYPRGNRCKHSAAASTGNANASPSTFVNASNPRPTASEVWGMVWNRTILFYLVPKAVRESLGKCLSAIAFAGRVGLHSISSIDCLPLLSRRCFNIARDFLYKPLHPKGQS